MYIIVSYDVNAKKCNACMKVCKKFLFHVHNSVFEGELTEKEYKLFVGQINKIVDSNDRVIIYKMLSDKYLRKDYLGVKKEIRTIII